MLKNAISRKQIKKTKIFRDQNKKNNQKKKEKKPL
jgi:hypothetical protein